MKKNEIFSKTFNYIKIIFLDGLLTILPITLTLALFAFFFHLLKNWLTPIYALEPEYLQRIPHSEIILVLILILLIGAIFRTFFIRSFVNLIESVFFKIPLMNPVYSGIKQLVQAFTIPEKLTFKQVVLVEFPRHGIHSLGFLTREVAPEMAPDTDKKYFTIYIPTTPNPTTGFLIIVPEGDFTTIDITRQEAMSLIISGGIIQPERFLKNETTID
ncbi:MAG: DUF502 domain-containing protein [Candidatus Babeliales bacterium]